MTDRPWPWGSAARGDRYVPNASSRDGRPARRPPREHTRRCRTIPSALLGRPPPEARRPPASGTGASTSSSPGTTTVVASSRASSPSGTPIATPQSLAAPEIGRAQTAEPSPTSTRIRIDVHTGERTLLRRLKTQALSGTLVATRGDTMPLAVQPGADPLRVPRGIVRDLYVSRGTPNRFESAVRRAAVPTVVSAALTALSLSVRQGTGDPSPARGARCPLRLDRRALRRVRLDQSEGTMAAGAPGRLSASATLR
jgi:hypothetical protein